MGIEDKSQRKEKFDRIFFEYIPEHYEGDYPYVVIRIKKSQMDINMKYRFIEKISSLIKECL